MMKLEFFPQWPFLVGFLRKWLPGTVSEQMRLFADEVHGENEKGENKYKGREKWAYLLIFNHLEIGIIGSLWRLWLRMVEVRNI